jgi:hypothetical protein
MKTEGKEGVVRMKLVSKIQFNIGRGVWNFVFKEEEEFVKVEFDGKEEFVFSFIYGELTQKRRAILKSVEKSELLQDIVQRIDKWEEKMKKELSLEKIAFITSQQKEEKEYVLFEFMIKSKIATRRFTLEETEEEEENNFLKYFSSFSGNIDQHQFVLCLEKRMIDHKIHWIYDEKYPLKHAVKSKSIPITLSSMYGLEFGCKTHGRFISDIIEKIIHDPAVRVKTLVM